MKLEELLLSEEQLDEIKLKHAIAAAAIAASATLGTHHSPVEKAPTKISQVEEKSDHDKLLSIVLDNYKVSKVEAEKIVKLAIKYEKPSFPKAKDILAIIGIESSFDKNAKSSLKKDPAIGLTQIRPKVWGIKPEMLKGNIELQIKKAVEILSEYYHKLGSEEKAIHAFNVGPTALKNGKTNHNYVHKFKTEIAKYVSGKKKLG